jgi:DNA-binding NarL/FixJ family response regulator
MNTVSGVVAAVAAPIVARLGLARQTDVVAEGLSNAEIGDRLSLAEKTVRHYMTAVLDKLDARSRVEAALIGYKAGLGRGR